MMKNSNPNSLFQRLKKIYPKAIRIASRKIDDYRLSYLTPPLGSKTFRFVQEKCLEHAAQALHVFGHTTLRGVLTNMEVETIAAGLADLGAGLSTKETISTVSPVEKSRKIQSVVFNTQLLAVSQKLLPDFWYYGSDAFVGSPVFSKHRDTFFSPPFFKIFIPLVPCTFSVLPGSHKSGDTYSREVGIYASTWDRGGEAILPVNEVHFQNANTKNVSAITHLETENLFLHRKLMPGDIFIFCQNAVHGLKTDVDKNFFLAVSVVPSPINASAYGLTRSEYLDRVIANIATSAACEYHLSSLKKIDAQEVLFTGYKFSSEDMEALATAGWHDHFGLRFIDESQWKQSFEDVKYKCFQLLQEQL